MQLERLVHSYLLLAIYFIIVNSKPVDHLPYLNPSNSTDATHLKVTQNGTTSGFAYSTSLGSANMVAMGYPSGIINSGGTGASWNGTTTLTQNLPSNTSTSVGGSLNSNCQGGMTGTYIAGQQGIGLNALGNCDSIVIPT